MSEDPLRPMSRAQVSLLGELFSPERIHAGRKDQRASTVVRSASGSGSASRRRIHCRRGRKRRESIRPSRGSIQDGGRDDHRSGHARSNDDGKGDFHTVNRGRIERGRIERGSEGAEKNHDRRDHGESEGNDLPPHGLDEAPVPPDHCRRARGPGAHGSWGHGRPLPGHHLECGPGCETGEAEALGRQRKGRWALTALGTGPEKRQRPVSPTRETRRRA
jgi:hypothetical protein